MLGKHTLPRWAVHLISSLVLAAWFLVVRSGSTVSGVLCVSSGELIYDCAPVNHPGSQEDLVSNWEPARSLVEDAISGAEFAPFQLWLSQACLPASCGGWASPQPASSPLVFAQSFVL